MIVKKLDMLLSHTTDLFGDISRDFIYWSPFVIVSILMSIAIYQHKVKKKGVKLIIFFAVLIFFIGILLTDYY